jgi:hypothetical protein
MRRMSPLAGGATLALVFALAARAAPPSKSIPGSSFRWFTFARMGCCLPGSAHASHFTQSATPVVCAVSVRRPRTPDLAW